MLCFSRFCSSRICSSRLIVTHPVRAVSASGQPVGDTHLDMLDTGGDGLEFSRRNHPQTVCILAVDALAGQRRVGLKRQRACFQPVHPQRLNPVTPRCIANIMTHTLGNAAPTLGHNRVVFKQLAHG